MLLLVIKGDKSNEEIHKEPDWGLTFKTESKSEVVIYSEKKNSIVICGVVYGVACLCGFFWVLPLL